MSYQTPDLDLEVSRSKFEILIDMEQNGRERSFMTMIMIIR